MELRTQGEANAIKTPTGYIPQYQDLKVLFKEVLNKDYPKEAYSKQFTIRIPESLAKIERIKEVFGNISDTPGIVFAELEEQKGRLLKTREEHGDYVLPDKL